jgi:hypothetical protein
MAGVGLVGLFAGGSTVALGDEMPGIGDDEREEGVTFGGGIGVVRVECDVQMCFDRRTAGFVDGHIGLMIAPRLALMLEGWGSSYEIGDLTMTAGQVGVGARFWPWARVWLSGAAGVAGTRVTGATEPTELHELGGFTPALLGTIGVEAISRPSFAVDLQLRSGVVLDGDPGLTPLSIGVGVSWY